MPQITQLVYTPEVMYALSDDGRIFTSPLYKDGTVLAWVEQAGPNFASTIQVATLTVQVPNLGS